MTTRKKTAPAVEPKAETPEIGESLYPIEYYKGAGIPYCETCGAPNPTGLSGEVICPNQSPQCPRITPNPD